MTDQTPRTEAAWNALITEAAVTTPYLYQHWADLVDKHRSSIEAQARAEGLDVEDWENIMDALHVAASYPQEMESSRERWRATEGKVFAIRPRLVDPR